MCSKSVEMAHQFKPSLLPFNSDNLQGLNLETPRLHLPLKALYVAPRDVQKLSPNCAFLSKSEKLLSKHLGSNYTNYT